MRMDEFGRYAATIEAAGEIKLERRIGRARGWRSIQKIRRDVARSRRLLRRAWDVAETGDMARAVEMAETAADMTR